MTNIINITSAKGGQGCTTVASLLACVSAHNGVKTLLVDAREIPNVRACIGLPNDSLTTDPVSTLGTNLSVVTVDEYLPVMAQYYDLIVVDGRVDGLVGTNVLVTRNCYMALRNGVESGVNPDHLIVLPESERALTAEDCGMVLRTPTSATTIATWDSNLTRSVDAGLLYDRSARPDFAPWAKILLSKLGIIAHSDKVGV